MNNNEFTIYGKITKVFPVRSGNKQDGSLWYSQDYLLDRENRDEETIVISAFGEERIKSLNIKEGQYLTAHLGCKAREYGGRYYNSIRVWKVDLDPTRVQP